jgi:hypothetical protein
MISTSATHPVTGALAHVAEYEASTPIDSSSGICSQDTALVYVSIGNVTSSSDGVVVTFSDGMTYLFETATLVSLRHEVAKFIGRDELPVGGADSG